MEHFTAGLDWKPQGSFPNLCSLTVPISVSNEKHVDYAWEVAKKLRDKWCSRADVDERNEMQFKIVLLKLKIPYQWSLGTREMENRGCKRASLWSKKKRETMSVDAFVG